MTTDATTIQPQSIDGLAYLLEQAKQAEADARQARLRAEEALLAAVPIGKDEGTTSETGAYYKVKVTTKLTRKVLPDKLEDVLSQVGKEAFGVVFKPDVKLNVRGLHSMEEANPEAYRIITTALETKPAKPAVSVERITTEES